MVVQVSVKKDFPLREYRAVVETSEPKAVIEQIKKGRGIIIGGNIKIQFEGDKCYGMHNMNDAKNYVYKRFN